jgi:hypothetical protein
MSHPQSFPKGRRRVPAGLVTLLFALGTAVPALAVDGVIEINQANTGGTLTIDQSGSYRLTSNLQAAPGFSSISIFAQHVTLDLNGFSIIGGGGSVADGIFVGAPVSADTPMDVEIRNGTIHSFSRHGILTNGFSDFVRVIGVRVMGNTFSGMELQGDSNTVDGCTALGNEVGIRAGNGSIIVNNNVRQNTGLGLVLGVGTGYGSNVITENNGGTAFPQVAGGLQLGTNLCGSDLLCP